MNTLIVRSSLTVQMKAYANFVKLMIYLVIFIHFLSCFWHLVTYANKDKLFLIDSDDDFETFIVQQWYPPLDWIDFTQSRLFGPDIEFFETYSLNYYYGILFLGQNEIGPVNPSEQLFCIFGLIISLMLNSFLFSDMAVIATFLQ